ncbi:MAG: PKD domain-containing protein [Solirubrobacterales bacterium]
MRLLVIAWALLLAVPASAAAIVTDVQSIDGPSADVVAIADAAMAEDGTGGIVWLRQVDRRTHVFVARFKKGAWGPAQRVDVGQNFDSSWAQIGAGNGGRLVATWVQEFGVESDRMFSATLDPGANGFQPPVPVDFNVGESTWTFPDLAMARGGQAYLAYRVTTDTSPSNPPGYIGADVRVARYNGRLWSVLGTPVDRNITAPVRVPTAENSPKVGIDIQGGGVVAWQEPDDEFVDRVWARRLFGANVGIPLQVSPSAWEGAPLRGPADAFSLDVAGFGQASVAFRQQPGQASKLDAPRAMVNETPDVFSELSGSFGKPLLIDESSRGSLGAPSVGVDPRGLFISGFSSGPASLLGSGDDVAAEPVNRLDVGASSVAGDPLVDLAETGASVAIWRELRSGTGLVAVRERRADGVVEPTELSAANGGGVGKLVLGGSGLGDAIVAWEQGTGANTQIAASVIDAPPDPFLVLLPEGWQRKPRIRVAWDRSPNAVSGVRYSVSVDDEPVIENRKRLNAYLSRDDIGDGRHKIQIFAVDAAGQETGSRVGPLRVDRQGPLVKLHRRGRRLTVVVSDGPRRTTSGVRRGSVRVSFGEGRGAAASVSRPGRPGPGAAQSRARRGPRNSGKAIVVRIHHTYGRSGRFQLTVKARDKAGNVSLSKREVEVG